MGPVLKVIALSASVLAAASAIVPLASNDSSAVVVDGTARASGLDAAEREDAAQLAASTGRGVDEVVAAMVGQADFVALVAEIESRFPGSYAASRWGDVEGAVGSISFVGAVPQQAIDLVSGTALSVELRGDALLSQREAVAQQPELYTEVLQRADVTDAVAVVDPATAQLELEVQLRAGATSTASMLESELFGVASSARSQASPALDVSVSLIPAGIDLGSAEAIRGGMQHSGCTAAFTVRSGSTYGVSTAAHCGATASYDGVSMRTSGTRSTVANDGDARWTPTVSATASDAFRYRLSPTAYRDVSSASNPVVGQAICAFGIQTGYQCDNVLRVNTCANGYCGVTFTYSEWSVSGDSGGPYFNSTVAHGIHHGEVYYNGSYRNVFTRIGAMNILGAVVIT